MARTRQTQLVTAQWLSDPENARDVKVQHPADGKFRRIQGVHVADDNGVYIKLAGAKPYQTFPAATHTIVNPNPMCLCGCGLSTKGGNFVPGHDARVHADRERLIAKVQDEGEELTDDERRRLDLLIDEAQLVVKNLDSVQAEYHEDTKCSAECWGARNPICYCSCAGENHHRSWFILAEMLGGTARMTPYGMAIEGGNLALLDPPDRPDDDEPEAARATKGTVKVGRWAYPAEFRPAEDAVYRNAKRDGSGEWTIADTKTRDTFTVVN